MSPRNRLPGGDGGCDPSDDPCAWATRARWTAHERTVIERDIAATDRQIDRLVYDLDGLTEEEIAIVEEGTK